MLNFTAVWASWRREREAVRELSRLSDRELADLGLSRSDIHAVAEEAAREPTPRASRGPAGPVETLAPAWGAHVRGSVAA